VRRCPDDGSEGTVSYEYEVAKDVEWTVASNPAPNENNVGEIKSIDRLKGKRVSGEPQGGHFKDLVHLWSICNFCLSSNPYDVWVEDLASKGVTDPQHAFMAIYGDLHYKGINYPLSNTKLWEFQDVF